LSAAPTDVDLTLLTIFVGDELIPVAGAAATSHNGRRSTSTPTTFAGAVAGALKAKRLLR